MERSGAPSEGGRLTRLIGLAVPLVACLAALHVVGWDSLFLRSLPANSDLPGHLYAPEFLRTELLPRGRLRGWSHDWFGGFPVYYFYFPLPALLIAALGSVVPPEVALRSVGLAPALLLPWALYAFGRWSGLSGWRLAGAVAGGSSFLFTTGTVVLGGNLLATVAGEFSYGWSLLFALLYLGTLGRATRDPAPCPAMPSGPEVAPHAPDTPRSRGSGGSGWIVRARAGVVPGSLLAAAILCHVIPALAAAGASLVATVRGSRRVRRTVAASWLIAGGLSVFWTLPMIARLAYAGDLGWSWTPGPGEAAPLEVVLLLPIALAGAVWTRRNRGLRMLLWAGLFGLGATLVPQSLVMQGRLLPLFFLAVHVFAGLGVAEGLSTVRGRPGRAVAVALVGLLPWTLVATARGTTELRATADLVLRGVDATPGADEFAALVDRLEDLPPGRLHWENDHRLPRWGSGRVFTLIPLMTDQTLASGLLRESSANARYLLETDGMLARRPPESPFGLGAGVAWNPSEAIRRLRALGVRYLVTVSSETRSFVASSAGSVLVDRFGDLALHDLGPVPLVEVVCRDPDTMAGTAATHRVSGGSGDGHRGDCPGAGRVADIELSFGAVRFRTEALGRPHLVRVSHFPNWEARGAWGPERTRLNQMLVVPERPTVELTFGTTWAERVGWMATLATVLLAIAVTVGAVRASTPFGPGLATDDDGGSKPRPRSPFRRSAEKPPSLSEEEADV